MAIKYNGNKAVLSGMREDVVAPNDFWQDFTKFLTKADYYNTKFKGNYDSYFGGLTADWDAQDYQNFFNANGITDAVQGNSNVDISKITDLNKLKAIMGSMVIDQKGHFSNNKYKLPSTEINKLKEGIKAFNAHTNLVDNLREKGGTDGQIQAILDSRDGSADGYTTLYDEIADLSGDDWNNYIDESLVNILPDNTWGESIVITPENAEDNNYTYNDEDGTYTDEDGNIYEVNEDNQLVNTDDGTPATTGGYTPSDSIVATATADDAAQTATTATQSAILGDSTLDALRDYVSQNEGYTLEEDADNNTYTVKDADGNTVDTFAVDERNNQIVYVGGEKDGQRFSTDGLPERIDTYQDIEDTTFADQQALADEVTGLREEYQTDMSGMLEEFDNADFAGQINAQLNQFLTGKDAEGNDILGEDGEPIKGFLDYQSDLETAAGNFTEEITALGGEGGLYDQAYRDYETALSPLIGGVPLNSANASQFGYRKNEDGTFTGPNGEEFTVNKDTGALEKDGVQARSGGEMATTRGKLGTVADAAMDVAADAGDQNYYTKLKNLLYADATDQIDRSSRSARDSLQQMYANAGMDTSSPAYTSAMMDLAKSRSDAQRSANRQAILDSYGLGQQMLGNRTNALNSAGSAYQASLNSMGQQMSALDSLYGVKLEGLNTRRDMIGQIYNANKNQADLGVSGLNTVLDTNLTGIGADQTQFNTKLNLNNDFYNNLFKNLGLDFNVTGGLRDYANKETTSAFDTLVDYDQSFKSDDFTMGSFQLALQQAYPDGNVPEPLQNLIDKYSSK